MTRIALARLGRDRLARAGALVLACLALVGVFADLLASDLPVALPLARDDLRPARRHATRRRCEGLDCTPHASASADAGDWMRPAARRARPAETPSAARSSSRRCRRVTRSAPTRSGATSSRASSTARARRSATGLAASLVLVLIGVALGALAGFAGGIARLAGVAGGRVAHGHPDAGPRPRRRRARAAPDDGDPALDDRAHALDGARAPRARRGPARRSATTTSTAARALGASPAARPRAARPAERHRPGHRRRGVRGRVRRAHRGGGRLPRASASPDATASWGEAMGEARGHAGAWWLVVFPGVALLATLVSLNLVGEAARDALDPRLRGSAGSGDRSRRGLPMRGKRPYTARSASTCSGLRGGSRGSVVSVRTRVPSEVAAHGARRAARRRSRKPSSSHVSARPDVDPRDLERHERVTSAPSREEVRADRRARGCGRREGSRTFWHSTATRRRRRVHTSVPGPHRLGEAEGEVLGGEDGVRRARHGEHEVDEGDAGGPDLCGPLRTSPS